MIIAVVVSVLLHLGFIVFVDGVPWSWDEEKPKRIKIEVSLKPAPPPPPQVVPEPPATPPLPQPEKTVPPRAPKPIPLVQDPVETVVARAPEPTNRTRTEVRRPAISSSSPASGASLVGVTPQVFQPPSDPSYEGNPKPLYPRKAKLFGWEGTVLLIVEVLADGTSGKIEIKQSSGYDDLDRAAVTAIRKWRFNPARERGIAVTEIVEIPIIFDMKE